MRREKDETDGKTYYGLVHQSVSSVWASILGVCAIAIRVQTDNVAQMATLLTPEEVVWFRKVRFFARNPVGLRQEELVVHYYVGVVCLYAQVLSFTRIARGSRTAWRTRTPCRINHGPASHAPPLQKKRLGRWYALGRPCLGAFTRRRRLF